MTGNQIKILSAGAPKTGVADSANVFEAAHGVSISIEFATAPNLRERIGNGAADADIIVAPLGAMDGFEADGKIVAGTRVRLGDIKAAVVVRDGAYEPDISTAELLKQEILDTDSLVYNKASSGQYIEKMIEALGIADAVRDKTLRTDSGAGVMEHLAKSSIEREIGFGQLTEIRVHDGRGTHLVGALPEGVSNITTYDAALLSEATEPNLSKGFIEFLATAEARAFFRRSGVE